jgi:predicted small metal-binding protein
VLSKPAGESGWKEEYGMLAMDCDCGYHMEAIDEEQLFRQAREHVDRDHPEMDLTNEQLRGILAEGAYTK